MLIEALKDPAAYDHPVEGIALLETHISWVLLTGQFAYKIKKPVVFGFLDFSTLEQRRQFCNEELRLNRRFAPQLYLDVVAVTGTPEHPRIGGDGPVIEYAVKMRQFPQSFLLDQLLTRGELEARQIDALAQEIASFHARIEVAGPDSPFGEPERVLDPVQQNFCHIELPGEQHERSRQLAQLQAWSDSEFTAREADLQRRKTGGFVRECHGDLHLGNIVLLDGTVTLFDCIEFNEFFRWIDVLSEVAFTVMDLSDRGRPDLADRLLNSYLECTGDFAGLNVLPFYLTYRAMVRAKVTSLRLQQTGLDHEAREKLRDELYGYLDLAERYTRPAQPRLLITHGLSGSGKTTGTQALIEALGAIRVRSDVERKRLFELSAQEHSNAAIYTPEANDKTYQRLAECARSIIEAGYPAVVDATFLHRKQREIFRSLAEQLRVPFVILDFAAEETVLRNRITERAAGGTDASEATLAVLDKQLHSHEPLTDTEAAYTIKLRSPSHAATDEVREEILRMSTNQRNLGSSGEDS